MSDPVIREDVCYGLLGPLMAFTPFELKMTKVLLSQQSLPGCCAPFADRVTETLVICNFLPKLAAVQLPAIASAANGQTSPPATNTQQGA